MVAYEPLYGEFKIAYILVSKTIIVYGIVATSSIHLTKKKGAVMQKQKHQKIKVIVGAVLFVLALGVVGQWDSEYEARASVCREYNGSTVCYQP